MRILVIEDEPAIAADLCWAVEDTGCSVAGVAGSVEGALALVAAGSVDAAILDSALHGVDATPIAEALRERRLPFFVLSGYPHWRLPASLAAAPFLAKPYDHGDLALQIRGLARRD